MNATSERLLRVLSELAALTGAYSVREDGQCVARQSTEHIQITSQTGKPGLTVRVSPQCQGEKVFIPACVTHGGVDDLVYNDFYIGAGAQVTIVAGCGVHTDAGDARHNGIHRFFLEPGAHVLYEEKHVGEGTGDGKAEAGAGLVAGAVGRVEALEEAGNGLFRKGGGVVREMELT